MQQRITQLLISSKPAEVSPTEKPETKKRVCAAAKVPAKQQKLSLSLPDRNENSFGTDRGSEKIVALLPEAVLAAAQTSSVDRPIDESAAAEARGPSAGGIASAAAPAALLGPPDPLASEPPAPEPAERAKRVRRVPQRWDAATGPALPRKARSSSPAPAAVAAPAPPSDEFFLLPDQKRSRREARAVARLQQDAAAAQAETAQLFAGRPLHPFFAPARGPDIPTPTPAATTHVRLSLLDAPLLPVHVGLPSSVAPPVTRLSSLDEVQERWPRIPLPAWPAPLLVSFPTLANSARTAPAATGPTLSTAVVAQKLQERAGGQVDESAIRYRLEQLASTWATRGASALWCVAGAPVEGSGVAGAAAAAEQLMRRLRTWHAGQPGLTLVGPTGAGKSALVAAVAASLGLRVLEIGPSLVRAGRTLVQHYNEATQSESLPAILSLPPLPASPELPDTASGDDDYDSADSDVVPRRRTRPDALATEGLAGAVMCFEEADVVLSDDRGFHAALAGIIRASKIPIVITAESEHALLAAELGRAQLHFIRMRRPRPSEAAFALDVLLAAAGRPLCVSVAELRALVRLFRCDVRRCTHQLQLLCSRVPPHPLPLGLMPLPPGPAAVALLRPDAHPSASTLTLLETAFAAAFEPGSDLPLLPLALAHRADSPSLSTTQLFAATAQQRHDSVRLQAYVYALAEALSTADLIHSRCDLVSVRHGSDGPFYAIEEGDASATQAHGLERRLADELAAAVTARAWGLQGLGSAADDSEQRAAEVLGDAGSQGAEPDIGWATCQEGFGGSAWRTAGAVARTELDAATRAIARSEERRRRAHSGRRFAHYLSIGRGSASPALLTPALLDVLTREAMRWPPP